MKLKIIDICKLTIIISSGAETKNIEIHPHFESPGCISPFSLFFANFRMWGCNKKLAN